MSQHGQQPYPQTPPAHSLHIPNSTTAEPSKKPAIYGLVGSVIAAVGSLLVWCVVEENGTELARIKPMDGGDGTWTLIASIVAAVLFLAGMVTRKKAVTAVAVIPALVSFGFMVVNVADPERLARQNLEKEAGNAKLAADAADAVFKTAEASAGPGLWIALIGATLALAAGVIAALKLRSN